jgi:hypothetical protein
MMRLRRTRAAFRPSVEMLEKRCVPSFTVTNLLDDGSDGSLRWAVGEANAAGGDQTIDFDPAVFATPQTITLSGTQLELTDTTGTETITGPAAGVTVSGNNASRVFQVDFRVTASISALTISGGHTTEVDPGGGLANLGGTLTLSDCSVSDNFTANNGGGLYANGGTTTLMNCTVSGNSSQFDGGGLLVQGGTITLTNCTVSGNSVTLAGTGGGLETLLGGRLTLTDCTVSGNSILESVGPGGGGLANFATTTLTNTIVAGNTWGAGASDIGGTANVATSSSYNLIGTGGSGGLTDGVNNNQVGVANPSLGNLGNHGGPTPTIDLLGGSAALNAGDPTQLGTPDQRGAIRTGGVNIGAYQASASAFLVNVPDTVQSGVPFDVIVTAVDPFNQVAVGYTGTVTFTTSDPDPGVVLPADYTFTLDDGGVHTFTDTGLGETTLITPGDQMLTVMDTADTTITGSATITVNSGPGPAPHRQGSPPSTLQPSPGQGDAWTRSEPSASEVVAADEWFVSFQPGDQGRATFMVTLNTQGPVHLTVTDTADNIVFAALDLIVL